jgi:hypothetical protein
MPVSNESFAQRLVSLRKLAQALQVTATQTKYLYEQNLIKISALAVVSGVNVTVTEGADADVIVNWYPSDAKTFHNCGDEIQLCIRAIKGLGFLVKSEENTGSSIVVKFLARG